MNDVQKIAFESLNCFINVCNKLELRYFLVNGSALGAKKYDGFIPWDDDIDIAMPRKDYEKFLSNAQYLLPKHLFVQNYRTDREFPFLYSKIRNSQTAFIEESVRKLNINHGVYIDIFPIDGCNEKEKIFKKFKLKILFWLSFCSLDDRSKTKIIIRNSILKFFGFDKKTDKALKQIEKLISNTDEKTVFCCNYADRQGKGKVLREWYGKGNCADFEGIDVIIPEKYDDYLTFKYGNWRMDLPEKEQKSHHKAFICDVDNSYKQYFNK